MFSHILYATDGSKHARKALDYACHLAKLDHARVTALHAYHPISDLSVLLGSEEYNRVLHHRLTDGNEIRDEALDALRAAGVDAERDLAAGPMAEAILKAAEVRGCDLIILGARGLSDLQGLLLGSVSHKVIQHATCPVLTVR